jgi:hypothetical protein
MTATTHSSRPATVTPIFPDAFDGLPADCEHDAMAGDYIADPRPDPTWYQHHQAKLYMIGIIVIVFGVLPLAFGCFAMSNCGEFINWWIQ